LPVRFAPWLKTASILQVYGVDGPFETDEMICFLFNRIIPKNFKFMWDKYFHDKVPFWLRWIAKPSAQKNMRQALSAQGISIQHFMIGISTYN
jgi:hypothetical protein